MERLHRMKETLMNHVQNEIGNFEQADAKELGEAVDMIKDFAEAIYYCTITEAMEGDKKKGHHYYTPMRYDYNPPYYYEERFDPWRDMDRPDGKMYYTGSKMPMEKEYPYHLEFRDKREGRSPMSRKMYMEAKEMKHGKEAQMKELEKYMQELTEDMTEMIIGASPDEKQLLQKKISTLAAKIESINV